MTTKANFRMVDDVAVGADRGDASLTLTVGTDVDTQVFATALTANRTITLATAVAHDGARFRIIRTGLGNFTLDVGGLATIPRNAGAIVEVEYNGTAWILAGYSELSIPEKTINQIVMFDDFLDAALDLTDKWAVLSGSDTEALDFVITATREPEGAILGVSGDGNVSFAAEHSLISLNDAAQLALVSDGGLSLEVRLHIDDITNVAFGVGLHDAIAAEEPFTITAGVVAAPAANDTVALVFDTGATTDEIQMASVIAGVEGNAGAEDATSIAPVNGTYIMLGIEIDAAGNCEYFINRVSQGTRALAVATTALLGPYIWVTGRTALSRSLTIDYIDFRLDRPST